MAFEFMGVAGVSWGYLFVIVIAGLALLVGKKKLEIIKNRKAKLEAERIGEPTKASETSPELEQVKDKEPEANGNTESKKDE